MYNKRKALLYGSLQGQCNVAGVLKAHALTIKHDVCVNCWAKKPMDTLGMDIAMMRAHTAGHDVTSSIHPRSLLLYTAEP